MKKLSALLLMLCCLALTASANDVPDTGASEEGLTRFQKTLILNGTGLAVLGVYGVSIWNYGESRCSHMNWEGSFGLDTKHGGMDKLGHGYTGYLIGRLSAEAYRDWGYGESAALWMGFGSSLFFTTMMEAGDSFSEFGLAPEDLVANTAGAALGYAFARYRPLADLIDLRLEYRPPLTGLPSDPMTDYKRMVYHLAVKGSGFSALKDTYLKYFDLNFGYYTRGFMGTGGDPVRHLTIGVGVNLTELLNGVPGSGVFKYYQLPYTSAGFDDRF